MHVICSIDVYLTTRYALLAFECTIVVLSAVALKRGVRKVKGKVEAVSYSVCAAVGLAAFVTFYALCYAINQSGYVPHTTHRL